MYQHIIITIELFLSLANNSILMIKFLNGKTSAIRLCVSFFAISILLSIFLFDFNQYIPISLFTTYFYVLYAIKNIKLRKKLYSVTLLQAFSMSVNSVISFFISYFCNNEPVLFAMDIIVNILILFILVLCKKNFFTDKVLNYFSLIGTGFKIYIIVSLYVISILSIIIASVPESISFHIWYKTLALLFILALVILSFIYPIFIANHMSKNYYKNSSKVVEEQVEAQTNYYRKITQNTTDLRKFKHDYQNQLIVLQSYLDNNELDAAKEYLNKSNNFLEQYNTFKTGNYILDALLYDKSTKASEYNIEISFNGLFIKNFEIDPTDLCIILGNALDNAIEACQKIDLDTKKEINIQVNYLNHLININISNPVLTPPKINNNFIVTTKSDHINHGLGLYSIKKTVEKYDGCLSIECTDNIFKLTVTFST